MPPPPPSSPKPLHQHKEEKNQSEIIIRSLSGKLEGDLIHRGPKISFSFMNTRPTSGIRTKGGRGPPHLPWPAALGQVHSPLPHTLTSPSEQGSQPACASRRLSRPNHKKGERERSSPYLPRTLPMALGRSTLGQVKTQPLIKENLV